MDTKTLSPFPSPFPSPSPSPSPTPTPTPAPAVEDVRVGTYAEFLYGRGDAPGLDLGAAQHYTRTGAVYRQQFERGATLANVGDVPVEVDLGGTYLDLDMVARRRVVLAPRSAEVLFSAGR